MATPARAEGKKRIPRAARSIRQSDASEDSRRAAPPARSELPNGMAEANPFGSLGKRPRGRPREQHGSVVLSLRLPSELVEAIDREVETSGKYRDRSEFIRQSAAQALTAPRPIPKLDEGRGRVQLSRMVTLEIDGEQFEYVRLDQAAHVLSDVRAGRRKGAKSE